MSKQIRVRLGPKGEIKVQAEGFKGESCEEATKFLEKLFGEKTDMSFTDEYYEEELSQEVTIEEGDGTGGWCG